MYKTISEKPCLTINGIYLLFDFVHLLKNICNLWLTEKTGELIFFEKGHLKVAKWLHLRKRFDLVRLGLLNLSDLTEVFIAPKPLKRQRISTCLQVFSDKTHTALLAHP